MWASEKKWQSIIEGMKRRKLLLCLVIHTVFYVIFNRAISYMDDYVYICVCLCQIYEARWNGSRVRKTYEDWMIWFLFFSDGLRFLTNFRTIFGHFSHVLSQSTFLDPLISRLHFSRPFSLLTNFTVTFSSTGQSLISPKPPNEGSKGLQSDV